MYWNKNRVDWGVRVGGFAEFSAREILNLRPTTPMVSNFDAFYFCKYLQDYKFGEIYV
jgi:hypothetical protein